MNCESRWTMCETSTYLLGLVQLDMLNYKLSTRNYHWVLCQPINWCTRYLRSSDWWNCTWYLRSSDWWNFTRYLRISDWWNFYASADVNQGWLKNESMIQDLSLCALKKYSWTSINLVAGRVFFLRAVYQVLSTEL